MVLWAVTYCFELSNHRVLRRHRIVSSAFGSFEVPHLVIFRAAGASPRGNLRYQSLITRAKGHNYPCLDACERYSTILFWDLQALFYSFAYIFIYFSAHQAQKRIYCCKICRLSPPACRLLLSLLCHFCPERQVLTAFFPCCSCT